MPHTLSGGDVSDVIRWATCSSFFGLSALKFSWSFSGFLGLISGWSWLEDFASFGFHVIIWAGDLNVDRWLFGLLGLLFWSDQVCIFGILFSCWVLLEWHFEDDNSVLILCSSGIWDGSDLGF